MRYGAVALVGLIALAGCGPRQAELSDSDAAAQIRARLETAQFTFYDGKQYPCSDTFTIESVTVTDKSVTDSSATVEVEAALVSKKPLDGGALIESLCFGVTWNAPFVAGQRGTWKSRYTFERWQSGWRLS